MTKLAAATAERTSDAVGASAYASHFAAGERTRLEEAIGFALEERLEGVPIEAQTTRAPNERCSLEWPGLD